MLLRRDPDGGDHVYRFDFARMTQDVAPKDIFLPFAPLTEARSVSYIGTRYENRHGIGAAWLTPAEATYAAGDA